MRTTLSTLVLFLLAAACSPGDRASLPARAAAPAPPPTPAPVLADEPLVVFLGDSLTAGYGLGGEQAYPALVEKRLEEEGIPVKVLNAGVSGDTTAGGLARLDWLLSQKPDVVVVGLGGNDGLRGLPLEQAEHNLREIVRRAKATGARVLLLGMQIPPNYGPEYAQGFSAMYPDLAKEMDIPLVPFLLEGVGGVADLNQADGIHPTAEGQIHLADNVVPFLEEMLGAEGRNAG
ncbi:MAG: acyl-CoA thioesterase [Acidobacteriota bacterium]|jgi:acyl-CoA thioesterase-1|nr:acyl-CoA thioesterase [Acidobacteriota bacterium]